LLDGLAGQKRLAGASFERGFGGHPRRERCALRSDFGRELRIESELQWFERLIRHGSTNGLEERPFSELAS
jgi:hypothetical protein